MENPKKSEEKKRDRGKMLESGGGRLKGKRRDTIGKKWRRTERDKNDSQSKGSKRFLNAVHILHIVQKSKVM